MLFSFTSTCARLQIDPWAYLHDVRTRLMHSQTADLAELLPDRWQAVRRHAASTNPDPSTAPAPSPWSERCT